MFLKPQEMNIWDFSACIQEVNNLLSHLPGESTINKIQ